MDSEKAVGIPRPGGEITKGQGPLKVSSATKVDGGEVTSLRKDRSGRERRLGFDQVS